MKIVVFSPLPSGIPEFYYINRGHMSSTAKSGFYGTDNETYYVSPAGRTWMVESADDLGTQDPVEISELPEGAIAVDHLLAPDEAVEHLRRIEAISGETLTDQD